MLTIIIVVILVLALVGGWPSWPHAGFGYGYYPSGAVGILLIVLLVLALMGRV